MMEILKLLGGNIAWVLGGIIAILSLLLGISKKQVKKQKKKVKEKEAVIAHQDDQAEIIQAGTDNASAVQETIKESEKEKEAVIEKVKEAKTPEEVIKVANDLVDSINSDIK